MKIAVVGATGRVGSRLVTELAEGGHTAGALTIHPEDVQEGPLVTAVSCDANDPAQLVPALRGHDVVVTSIQYRKTDHEASSRRSRSPVSRGGSSPAGPGRCASRGRRHGSWTVPTSPPPSPRPLPPPSTSGSCSSA